MVGMLLWKSPRPGKREKAVTIREWSILHVRFQCAEILRGPKTPEAVLRRRVATAGKRLRKLGISRVVLPEDFLYEQQLRKLELQPVSTMVLRRALAADWVRWILTERGVPLAGARVAVCAESLTGEVVRTVTELVLRHRYVLLDLPYGGEDLCRQLRREYGVSLLLGASQDQLEGAEVLVQFDNRREFHGGTTLAVYDESVQMPPMSLPPVMEERLPAGVNREQILAVLYGAGAIRSGQIVLGSSNFTK